MARYSLVLGHPGILITKSWSMFSICYLRSCDNSLNQWNICCMCNIFFRCLSLCSPNQRQWCLSIKNAALPFSIIKMRWSHEHLIFIMRIPILAWWHTHTHTHTHTEPSWILTLTSPLAIDFPKNQSSMYINIYWVWQSMKIPGFCNYGLHMIYYEVSFIVCDECQSGNVIPL